MQRLPWPEYFMDIAYLVSLRSTCARRRVGAIAVKDRRILATGYNGAPAGASHCLDQGCLRQSLGIPSGQRHEICRGLHAEQNIIIQAAMHGINIGGADLYSTNQPCVLCAKMIINCGFARVFYAEPYPDQLAAQMLAEAGIVVEQLQMKPLCLEPGILVPDPVVDHAGKVQHGEKADDDCANRTNNVTDGGSDKNGKKLTGAVHV